MISRLKVLFDDQRHACYQIKADVSFLLENAIETMIGLQIQEVRPLVPWMHMATSAKIWLRPDKLGIKTGLRNNNKAQ